MKTSTTKKTILLNQEHRIAICFSGLMRKVDNSYDHWKPFFNTIPCSYDIFAHGPDASKILSSFPKAIVKEEPDPIMDSTKLLSRNYMTLRGEEWRYNSFLIQMHGFQQVNLLRKKHEKANNIRYDLLIRARTDIAIGKHSRLPKKIDMNSIYIPDFCHCGGLTDRFAIGSTELMDVYMNIIDSYYQEMDTNYTGTKWAKKVINKVYLKNFSSYKKRQNNDSALSAEMYLSHWLRHNNVPVTLLLTFNMDIVSSKDGKKRQGIKKSIFKFACTSNWHFPLPIQYYLRIKGMILDIKHFFLSYIHMSKYFLRTNRYTAKTYKYLKHKLKKS